MNKITFLLVAAAFALISCTSKTATTVESVVETIDTTLENVEDNIENTFENTVVNTVEEEVEILEDKAETIEDKGEEAIDAVADTIKQHLVGGDRDEHGCILSAGYVWCEKLGKCIRPWEEKCE